MQDEPEERVLAGMRSPPPAANLRSRALESDAVWKPRALGARFAFRPETLPPDLVTVVALGPPIAAGLLLFRVAAADMLGIAIGVGAIAHLAARLSRQPVATSPVVTSIVGVALLGPGAPHVWTLAVAALAAVLELGRARIYHKLHVETGLLAYSILFLADRTAMTAYLRPPGLDAFPEPIRLWLTYFPAGAAPIDPIRLYVGNVAGPVFATSLLAVLLGAAWFWNAKRLEIAVPIGFAIGAVGFAVFMHWDPVYQIDSGPTWFAVAFVLADRKLLPVTAPPVVLTLIGVAAGVAAIELRTRGFAVESAFLTVAAFQVGQALIQGLGRMVAHRRGIGRGLVAPFRRPPVRPVRPAPTADSAQAK